VNFSKIGDFHLNYHRPPPADGDITQIILKKEKTGDWTVSIVVDYDPDYPKKSAVENISPEETVGIDLGITKFIHDSNNHSFESLDEQQDRERIDRRHRNLSRKEYGSNNWQKARQSLARAYERLSNRRKDYREKLAHEYTTRYDAVFLEDLEVRSMTEGRRNSRNVAAMSWRQTIQAFKRHGEKNGCHVIEVPPEGTTKRCSQCGCSTEKPLWVREHSCPACGFKADRDYNAALEIKRLGLEKLGIEANAKRVGQGMAESTSSESQSDSDVRTRALLSLTPVETALPTDTETTVDDVSVKRVVETGSSCLKERTALAVSE